MDYEMKGEMKESAEKSKKRKKSCFERVRGWHKSPSFFIYINYFLSQWGDWMWQFAVGLYLVHIDGNQLRLAAIFGFAGGSCVLLFGGVIGDYVDRNQRLKVVRVSLFIQNLSVSLSALSVCLILAFGLQQPETKLQPHGDTACLDTTWQPPPAEESSTVAKRILLELAVIVMAIVAQLASVAYKIAIEKDWLVVIAAGKSSRLANLNATTRSLDLGCKVVAPLTVGLVMTYGSLFVSALCIAAWNIVSVFIEYTLVAHVFSMVPKLAIKKKKSDHVRKTDKKEAGATEMQLMNDGHEKIDPALSCDMTTVHTPMLQSKTDEESHENGNAHGQQNKHGNDLQDVQQTDGGGPTDEEEEKSCVERVFEPFVVVVRGWRTYVRQKIVFAGVSLALLYMTVLGFDSITLAYIAANDVSEWMVGLSMGLAGVTGIIGTVMFTCLHRLSGLNKTGIVAFISEIICLTLAVASIWTPGSRFDPNYVSFDLQPFNATDCVNRTTTQGFLFGVDVMNSSQTDEMMTADWTTVAPVNTKSILDNISILLLLVGIISSRVGLWMADLVVTQLMQESIIETERGIVNGVQNSLNMLMDMLKFILVILLPRIEIFGIHIILSFIFICLACMSFIGHVVYSRERPSDSTRNRSEVYSEKGDWEENRSPDVIA